MHPTAVTQNGNRLSGRGDMGGVWEWTSSVLERWDQFEPMGLYPAYTDDFFDGKHNVVLGGSWYEFPFPQSIRASDYHYELRAEHSPARSSVLGQLYSQGMTWEF